MKSRINKIDKNEMEQKRRLLIKLKKSVGMNIDKEFINNMEYFELNAQIKHYKQILSASGRI